MKKITELRTPRWRTVHTKDIYGNREEDREEYMAIRIVKTVSPGQRFGHFILDLVAFQIIILIVQYFFAILLSFTEFSIRLNLTIDLIRSIISLLLYPSLYAFCEYKWQ